MKKTKCQYDQEASVLYVTFDDDEPTYVVNLDDALLIEVGFLSNKPKGFRILGLNVRKEQTVFFAENDRLNICATGESHDAAINAFIQHLLYFCKHYNDISLDKVTGEARKLKHWYSVLRKFYG